MRSTLQKTVLALPMLLLAFVMQAQDLAVGMRTNVSTAAIGGQVTFTVVVINQDVTAASGVVVQSAVPLGSTYVSDNTGGTYNSGTGVWTVGSIPADDSVELHITVRVDSEGVLYTTAELTASNNPDPDSTPGNGSVLEDDWSGTCITVPMRYNCRDNINVLATAHTGYTNYQWFRNGVLIAGADKDTYRIRGVGDYTYTASTLGLGCPAYLCCPISVVRDSCLSIGNLVFNDKDNNGLFDGTDSGINGVQVQLWSAGLDELKGTVDDVLDSMITTAGGGLYVFNTLNPGLYYVKLTGTGVPTGFVSSTGGGVNDNSGAGTYEPATLEESIDNNDNGTKMSGSAMIMSDTIRLTLNGEPTSEDGSANTNLTIDFGLYKPQCISPEITTTFVVTVCNPLTVDLAALTITDNNNVVGALSYYATATDAVNATNPLSSTLISGVGSATYWIRKEGSFAPCYDTVSVVVTINAKPVYTDGLTTSCEGTRVNLTNFIGGYGSIVNPIWTESGNAVADATVVTPSVGSTTFTLIGETAFGCKDTANVVVNVNPKPVYGDGLTTICERESVDLTTLIMGYGSILNPTWTQGGNPVANATKVTPLVNTTYTLIGENGFSCKDTADVVVTVNPKPIYADGATTVCENTVVDLTSLITAYGSIVNPTWTKGGNPVADPTQVTPSVGFTTYSLIGETAFGCKDTADIIVTVNRKPIYDDATVAICQGESVDLTSLITGYSIIVNPTWTESGNAVADPTQIKPLADAVYTLIGETAFGCKDTADVLVTVYQKPVYADEAITACQGEPVDLTSLISDYINIVNPIWTEGGNSVADATQVTPLVNTTYTLIGETAFGCKDTAVVVITVNPKPVYADGATTVCENTVVDLTALISGYGSIVNPTWIEGGNAVADATQVTPSVNTTYTLIGETAFGCKDTADVVVTINPKPVYADAATTVCENTVVDLTSLISGYGSIINPTWKEGGNAVADATQVTVSVNTTYTLIGESAFGCKDTADVVVTINPKPVYADAATTVCEKTVVDLTSLISSYSSIVNPTWTAGGNAVVDATQVTPSVNTTYTLIGESAFGCKDTAVVVVTVNPKPVYADAQTSFCEGTLLNVDLTALITGYGSILNPTWTAGGNVVADATNVLATLGSTTYTLIGESAFGCKDTADVVITVLANPVYNDSSITVLQGASVDLTSLIVDYVNILNPSWTESGNAVADATNVTPSVGTTTYRLIGENATACKDTAYVDITIDPKPVYRDSFITVCQGATVDLTNLIADYGSIVNPTWSESGNTVVDPTQVIPALGVTTYIFIGENLSGYKDTADVVVTVNPKPVYADASTTICEGARVNLTSLIAGYGSILNPTWTHGGNAVVNPTQVTPSVGSTIYTLIGENASGCKDTADVVVTVNPKPIYADATLSTCVNTVVNLTSLITGYGSIINPIWTKGGVAVANATQVIPVLGVNTYTLIGENVFGCKDTARVVVTVYAKPNAGPDQYLTCIGVNAPSAYNFGQAGTWSVLTQPVGASAAIGGTGFASNMRIAGQYHFVLDKNGCKDTAVIIIPDCACTKPDISVANPIVNVCAPATVNVFSIAVTDAANVSGTLSYHATANDAVTGANPLSNTTVSAVGTARIWIRKLDGTGFCFDTLSVVITIHAKPAYNDASITVCQNIVVDLTASITNYGTIANPTWTISGQAVADATQVTPSVGTTTYRLIGESAAGCKDTADVSVTVYTKPNAGADRALTCSGGSTPSTFDFAHIGTWTILSQPLGATASIDGAGQASGLTIEGDYTFELEVNGCKDTVNVSVQICLNLGNLVWNDANNNGIKDISEVGIPNIQVELYATTDNIKGNYDDVLIETKTTDSNGNPLQLSP